MSKKDRIQEFFMDFDRLLHKHGFNKAVFFAGGIAYDNFVLAENPDDGDEADEGILFFRLGLVCPACACEKGGTCND